MNRSSSRQRSRNCPKTRRRVLMLLLACLSVAICVQVGAAPAQGESLVLHFSDLMFDESTGYPDLVGLSLQFDRTSGQYELWLFAREDSPFQGNFRINVNLYNGRLGPGCEHSLFRDVTNDFESVAATQRLRLAGQSAVLTQWQEGDLVAAGVLGLGVPDCTSQFHSEVQNGDRLDRSAVALISHRTMPLTFGVTDPQDDQQLSAPDVHAVNVQFDPASGEYRVQVAFAPDAPWTGALLAVFNGFNQDLGTTACDPALAGFYPPATNLVESSTVEFSGVVSTLQAWSAGDRVALNSAPFGSPDCSSFFRSSVRNPLEESMPEDQVGEAWRYATVIDVMHIFRDGFESGDVGFWSTSGR